jgi:hypothetical protein
MYSEMLRQHPCFTSSIEAGYIRLRQIKMLNSGKPELRGRGRIALAILGALPLLRHCR